MTAGSRFLAKNRPATRGAPADSRWDPHRTGMALDPDAEGLKPSPHAGCDGRSLPGFMMPSGSKTRLKRAMKPKSASPNWSGLTI